MTGLSKHALRHGGKVEHLVIAVEKLTSNMATVLRQHYPDTITLKEYNSDNEAFSAFIKGDVDGFAQEFIVLDPRK
jgi:ABC-type amino acid transport substrate-binding protein